VIVASSNRSGDSRAKEDTRGETAKDYVVRKDPDVRGAGKARREESDRFAKKGRG
jgi:hypothetical protein